jgi:hypothetical protein
VTEVREQRNCLRGSHAPVPSELEAECLCVPHFLESVERACGALRRETVAGTASKARHRDIRLYVRTTAETLSRVAVTSPALSDTLKKRVLTTFLTLMNLQESLERTAKAKGPEEAASAPSATQLAAHAAHG